MSYDSEVFKVRLAMKNMTAQELDGVPVDNTSSYSATDEDLKNTNYVMWYSDFQAHCFPSIILELPEEVVRYLKSPTLVLPENTPFSSESGRPVADEDDWDTSDLTGASDFSEKFADSSLLKNGEDSDSSDDEPDTMSKEEQTKFTELDRKIENAIKSLGGSAFPKLNWQSPKVRDSDHRFSITDYKKLLMTDLS